MYEYRKLTPEQRRQLVLERRAKGFPPHSPPHFHADRALYLLTAACFEHVAHMATADRRLELLDRLFEDSVGAGLEICAWVVLPNHYHLLAHVADAGCLGTVFGRTHGVTSHQWNEADGARGRKVWYRYSDRAIRSERHYYTTLNYIHFNPVKHQYVSSPYDWRDSSVHWYLEQHGREWLRELWVRYPVKGYGTKWDDFGGSS